MLKQNPRKLKTFVFGDSEPNSKIKIPSWLLHILKTICHVSLLCTSKRVMDSGPCNRMISWSRGLENWAIIEGMLDGMGYLDWRKYYLRGIVIVYFKYLKDWYKAKERCSVLFQKAIYLFIAMGRIAYFSPPSKRIFLWRCKTYLIDFISNWEGSISGIGILWPSGQIRSTLCFINKGLLGAQPCPFVPVLSAVVFVLQRQRWAFATETGWTQGVSYQAFNRKCFRLLV